jgi:ATP-binding cassette subfamily B protein
MEHGRIIERGGHHALLLKNGTYAQMWALQQEEEAETALPAEKMLPEHKMASQGVI